MLHKLPGMLVWTLLVVAVCFGQISFQRITPGNSTRSELTRVLGQPLRAVSATVFEYNPPAGIARVEVEYESAGEDPTIKHIEVYLPRPISRPALIQKFSLPQQSDAKKANQQGNLVEYFSGSALLALTYSTPTEIGGVISIGYYSKELFGSLTGLRSDPRAPVDSTAVPPKQPVPTNGRTIVIPDGTRFTAVTTEKISSRTAEAGDRVVLRVDEPLVVDGRVVVEKGTTVIGTIVTSGKSEETRSGGKLAFKVESTTATDGQVIKLRAAKNKGDDTPFHTVSLTPLFSPIGLSASGEQVSIKRGLKLKVYTDQETRVLVKN